MFYLKTACKAPFFALPKWLFTIGSILLISCTHPLELEPPEVEPMLVVNSFFTPAERWEVQVSQTTSVLDTNEIPPIRNAIVNIFENNRLIGRLTHEGEGIYSNTGVPSPSTQKRYTLRASAPRFEPVEASDILPVTVLIQSTEVRRLTPSTELVSIEITVYFQDPLAPNYYGLFLYGKDTHGKDSPIPFMSTDPVLTQRGVGSNPGHKTVFTSGSVVFNDIKLQKPRSLIKIETQFHSHDFETAHIELATLSKNFFDYTYTAELQKASEGNPFVEPVFIASNVNNGLGIFAGFSNQSKEVWRKTSHPITTSAK